MLELQHEQTPAATPRREKLLSAVGGAARGSPSPGQARPFQLDLGYLLGLQNLGYDVLKYFKLANNNEHKASMGTKEQMAQGVNEIKQLINASYQFYSAQENTNELLQNCNPYYECFLEQLIPSNSEAEKAKFLKFLQESRFP